MTKVRAWGKPIVFDGGEGAGKGTVLKELQGKFPDVKFTREPGGTPLAEKVREVLLSDLGAEADALTTLLLFFAARNDHMKKVIIPALEKGQHIISDRFDSSSWAYQVVAMNEGRRLTGLFHTLRQQVECDALGTLYVYLDLDPVIGLARVKGRGESNHLDEREIEFHQRVREGYKEFVSRHGGIIVDASRTLDEVTSECVVIVSSHLA